MHLEWFNWSQPALPQAVQWFVARFVDDAALDLSKLLVCVPGAQVRRRLLELLVEAAEEHGLLLTPPEIVTPGVLPEKLYRPKHPFAGELAQQLAWVKVLQATDVERLAALVRNRPEDDDLPAWLALGKMLADLHRELLADKFDCADVLKAGAKLPAFNEAERWKLLRDLERRYLDLLDSLQVWDIQTARKFAVEHRECKAPCPIVLVGLVDLNRIQRLMLDQVSEQVTALVFTPPRDDERVVAEFVKIPESCARTPEFSRIQLRGVKLIKAGTSADGRSVPPAGKSLMRRTYRRRRNRRTACRL